MNMEQWEKKTFKGFQGADMKSERKKSFDLLEGETIKGSFPFSWKKGFDGGIEIHSNVRNCKVCL